MTSSASAIEHFTGTLDEYIKKYPGKLIVQSRIKSDLMINYIDRADRQQGAFLPRSLPTDLTMQATAESLRRSDDLQRLVATQKVLLVVPNESEYLKKGITASASKLATLTKSSNSDLYTVEELNGAVGGDKVAGQVSVAVTRDVRQLNLFFSKDPDAIFDADSAVTKIIELGFSCETPADRAFVEENISDKAFLKQHWEFRV